MIRRAIVLGAGRGIRRLDFTKSYPAALEQVTASQSALDWNVSVLRQFGVEEIAFVGGYHIEKIIERHPSVTYFYDAAWQQLGELASLARARDFAKDGLVLLCRGEVLLTQAALQPLRDGAPGHVAGMFEPMRALADEDSGAGRTTAFVALQTGAAEAFELARQLAAKHAHASLDDLIESLTLTAQARVADVTGHAASVRDRSAVARLLMQGKAQTLERLSSVLRSARILGQQRFTASRWREDRDGTTRWLQSSFGTQRVVVRSSAAAEDHFASSGAGRFTSVLDVPCEDAHALARAVDEVIESFAEAAGESRHEDHVFVQPYLANVAASGVMFTRELDTAAPYYVMNIDRDSGRTDVVTAGREGRIVREVVHRDAALTADVADDVRRLLATAHELEELLFHDALDIEFAFTRDGQLYVLQVRPLAATASPDRVADEDVHDEIEAARTFLAGTNRPRPSTLGASTVLGVMPDWNPAEMIGIAPRRLALSLYQRLIGDRAWALARARIGYRDVTPTPLIVALCGRPYVDVRASLSSFLPRTLPDALGARIVDAQLAKLRARPELHDKIEFEIAWTCNALDFEQRRADLDAWGLSRSEALSMAEGLRTLTCDIVAGRAPTIDDELARLQLLERRRRAWAELRGDEPASFAAAAWALLSECERHGTEPFSVLARYAFIAITFLRSLRARGVLSAADVEAVQAALPTVGGEISSALARVHAGQSSRDEFLGAYGHLRPNTYDVTSPSYREQPDTYLGGKATPATAEHAATTATARDVLFAKRAEIDALLRAEGFDLSCEQLASFIAAAIPARERAKFEFTRTLDTILGLLARWAACHGFDRAALSHLSIDTIGRAATDAPSAAVRTELLRDVEFARKRWALSRAVALPPLLVDERGLTAFTISEAAPNYVTSKRVVAPVHVIAPGSASSTQLDDHIVVAESADPGYDWIFSHRVAGLITRYGGVASHMAIRAAEFGLPAAIGCGELLYERARAARVLELDCSARALRVLR